MNKIIPSNAIVMKTMKKIIYEFDFLNRKKVYMNIIIVLRKKLSSEKHLFFKKIIHFLILSN